MRVCSNRRSSAEIWHYFSTENQLEIWTFLAFDYYYAVCFIFRVVMIWMIMQDLLNYAAASLPGARIHHSELLYFMEYRFGNGMPFNFQVIENCGPAEWRNHYMQRNAITQNWRVCSLKYTGFWNEIWF